MMCSWCSFLYYGASQAQRHIEIILPVVDFSVCHPLFLLVHVPHESCVLGNNGFQCTWAEGSSALLWSRIVRRPSVVCLSVVNFSYFRLLLWNRRTEFKESWQEARSQHPLPSLCFLGRSEKQDWRPGLWLAESFLTSSLKPRNGIQRNLTGSKISTSSTKLVFFGPVEKTRWPPWPLIGWDIFHFFCETAERNWPFAESRTCGSPCALFDVILLWRHNNASIWRAI